jgi:hypothetical protein
MVKKESTAKVFVLCLLAFVLGSLFAGSAFGSIDYKDRYELEYKWPVKKSWRKIMRDVIKRKKQKPLQWDNTIPIPLYDAPNWERRKNVA